MRRFLSLILEPMLAAILRFLPVDDPWERFPYRVPLRAYGVGSLRDFEWYFEGESTVSVSSLDEIQDWLVECEYADDMEVFQEKDFWQHPRTFEMLRRGDCEDHALWAWRKLVELGYDAELISGQQLAESGGSHEKSGHVWVVLKKEEESFVFETASKSKEEMLKPMSVAREHYRPEVGVDAKRNRFAYYGALLTLRDRQIARKLRRTA
jgi:hypothetical protein